MEDINSKKRRNPRDLLVRTDSLKDDATSIPTCSSIARFSSWRGISAELLVTPQNCINSARRALCIAQCELEGMHKVWMRLELRRGMQSLMAGAGNGRLKGLKQNLCIEFSRSLDIPVSCVGVCDIYEIRFDLFKNIPKWFCYVDRFSAHEG